MSQKIVDKAYFENCTFLMSMLKIPQNMNKQIIIIIYNNESMKYLIFMNL